MIISDFVKISGVFLVVSEQKQYFEATKRTETGMTSEFVRSVQTKV